MYTLEPERREFAEPLPYRFQMTRRGFMHLLGAGLLVTVTAPSALAQRGAERGPAAIAARLHVGEDGTITVLSSKVEFGQGSRTEITQAAAEELRVTVKRIRLIMADTALVPDDGGTFGSRTTPYTLPDVRRAAAAAREALTDAAADRLGVPREALAVRDGVIHHAGSGTSLSFGALAASDTFKAASVKSLSDEITLTPVNEWHVMGTSVPKIDGASVVTGAHRYPSDITRPGMVYGKVLRASSYGAKLLSIDLTQAQAMSGVVAVRDGDFVGCTAPTSWLAGKALATIAGTAQWESKFHPSSKELFSYLKANTRRGEGGFRGPREDVQGNVEGALAQASKTLSSTYEIAYIQHVPMEPRAAVAEWEDEHLTVWTGTQRPDGVRDQLAEAFGLTPERVRVIVPDTGGGFGGKHTGECAVEAARLARAAQRPVSLRWTREEEFAWAYFRPAGLLEVKAGLDENGRLLAWDFANYNSGAAALACPYRVENRKEAYVPCNSPLRTGSYRALAATANNFARECAMDELAALAEQNPLEFRLAHLDRDHRLAHVLSAAAERFGWPGKTAPGVGYGIACGTEKGSYVAACAEVHVDAQAGRIDVIRLCHAYECGAIVNPRNLRAQVEGCVIMGLGATLFEEIRFENGRILNGSLREYRVPRFRDVPTLDFVFLNRRDLPSVGGSETPIIAVAPAVANAVYDACGVRLRGMPLRAENLKP